MRIRNTNNLPTGTFVKIQPQHPDFLEITDPKAVCVGGLCGEFFGPGSDKWTFSLENVFRNFSILTQGDIISISYNKKVFDILIMEIKPATKGAISILETDLEVDFAAPLGYVEPEYKRPASATVCFFFGVGGEQIGSQLKSHFATAEFRERANEH